MKSAGLRKPLVVTAMLKKLAGSVSVKAVTADPVGVKYAKKIGDSAMQLSCSH